MMTTPESTSAEAFNQYLRGRLIAASNGWKNLLVRIYSEPRVEESVVYPAVAEPRIVRILSGAAEVEERELGGPWLKTRVEAGDFFLTASQSPYEFMRPAEPPLAPIKHPSAFHVAYYCNL
jgi:AraC family transcriptional regulator